MKHSETIIAAALIAVSFCMVSCKGNIDPVTPDPSPTGKVYLDASIDDYQTKTTLEINESKGKTNWQSGDQIKVFSSNGDKSETFSCAGTKESDATIGRFFADNEASAFEAAVGMVAYYPGANASAYSSGLITASVPATQTYVENSFGPGAAPMVSNEFDASSKTFKFRNVFGGAIIQLWSDTALTVTKIEVSSASTILSGDFQFSPDCDVIASGTNKTLTMLPDVALSTDSGSPTTFCFMMPGLSSNEEVTVKITVDGTNTYTRTFYANRTSTPKNTLTANSILRLGALKVGTAAEFTVSIEGWNTGGTVETITLN